MAGIGLSLTKMRQALSKSPACAWSSQAWIFSPAGQAWLQGGIESTNTGCCSRTGPVPDVFLRSGGKVMSVRTVDMGVMVSGIWSVNWIGCDNDA
jgi:hypothetical protein